MFERHDGAPDAAVLIPTRNRAAALERCLASLELAIRHTNRAVAVVVIDNGSTDETPRLLARWCADAPRNRRVLTEPRPGRARALNSALAQLDAPLFIFFDDDMWIAPDCLTALLTFAATHSEYAAGCGTVLLPDEIMADRELVARITAYDLLPLRELAGTAPTLGELFGGNIFIRRVVFDQLGRFDERLGAGAAGYAEDTELGWRMLDAGMKIAAVPEARTVHEADPARLGPAAARRTRRLKVRTWHLLRPDGHYWISLLRLVEYSARWSLAALAGNAAGCERASVAWVGHAVALQLRWRHRWALRRAKQRRATRQP